MRFSDFYLNEAKKGQNDPRNTPHAVEEAIHILNTHCKEALPLLANDTPMMRYSHTNLKGFTVVDPTKVKRESITSPVLTILNDLLAEKRPDLPRRNYSVYGTFGEPSRTYGDYLQMIVPFDGAKFAVAEDEDYISQPPNVDSVWDISSLSDAIMGIRGGNYKKILQSRPSEDLKEVLEDIMVNEFEEDETVYNFIKRTFDPKVTLVPSVSALMGKARALSINGSEVWTEGPVMIVDQETWAQMYDAYVKNYLASKGKRI